MPALQLADHLRFIRDRPRLLARVVRNYARMLSGTPRLRSLDLDLTYSCPCKCEQCYSDDYLTPELGLLTIGEIVDCVDQAVGLGAIHVNLTGGEPLLRTDLEAIVSICHGKETLVSICSSGAGLTAGRLDGLIQAGLGVAIFSLDSADSGEHDENRGVPGLHDSVLRLIDHGRMHGLRVMVNTVATAEKLESDQLRRLLQVVRQHGAVLNLTIPTPCGRWDGNDDVLLTDAHQRLLRRFLETPGVRTDTSATYWGTSCPAGHEKLAIGAYGDVRACQLIPSPLGNVRTANLAEIWARMGKEPTLRNRRWFCPAGDQVFRTANPDSFPPRGPIPPSPRS